MGGLFSCLFISITILVNTITKVLKESERLIVFRFGMFHSISGPGIVFLIPGVETAKKIDLENSVPNWLALSKVDLKEKLLKARNIDGDFELHESYFHDTFLELLKKAATFMNPGYDLGIENICLRGLIRIGIGITLPTLLGLISMVGAWIYDASGFSTFEYYDELAISLDEIIVGLPFIFDHLFVHPSPLGHCRIICQ